MDKIKVIKRDKTTEDFNENKINRIAKAAGLSDEQIQTLLKDLNDWLLPLAGQAISTFQIREKMLAELKKLNSNAYNLYSWYEENKYQK